MMHTPPCVDESDKTDQNETTPSHMYVLPKEQSVNVKTYRSGTHPYAMYTSVYKVCVAWSGVIDEHIQDCVKPAYCAMFIRESSW